MRFYFTWSVLFSFARTTDCSLSLSSYVSFTWTLYFLRENLFKCLFLHKDSFSVHHVRTSIFFHIHAPRGPWFAQVISSICILSRGGIFLKKFCIIQFVGIFPIYPHFTWSVLFHRKFHYFSLQSKDLFSLYAFWVFISTPRQFSCWVS